MTRASTSDPELPPGVRRLPLACHHDGRGLLFEAYRESFAAGFRPVQWNVVASNAGVLRGVHAHAVHHDYLLVLTGFALVGLKDLRPDAAIDGPGVVVKLPGDAPCALIIPPGVAHGFYFPERSLHTYAVSHYWDPDDEMGCRWDDPDLAIPWPRIRPSLSDRDASAGSLAELREGLSRRWVG